MAEGIGLAGALEQARYELQTVAAGATFTDRIRIVRMLAHAHLRIGRLRTLLRWLPQAADPPRVVRLRSGSSILCRRADVGVLYEHFGANVYEAAASVEVVLETVVDLGANIGMATIALARNRPGARFVCVEPAAETRALLEANLARNGVKAEIIAAAITGRSGNYQLEAGRTPGMTRVTAADGGAVEGLTFLDLLERTGLRSVDFLKIDIEGGERELFQDAVRWGPRVGTLVAELHDGLSAEEAAALLHAAGFEPVVLEPGLRHHGLVCFTSRGRRDHSRAEGVGGS